MIKSPESLQSFIEYLVDSMNEDVYYQLKSWLQEADLEGREYSEALDYFVENLNGGLVWDTDA